MLLVMRRLVCHQKSLFPQRPPDKPPRCKVGEGPWHTLCILRSLLLTVARASGMGTSCPKLVKSYQTATATCVLPQVMLPMATAAPSVAPLVQTKPTAS